MFSEIKKKKETEMPGCHEIPKQKYRRNSKIEIEIDVLRDKKMDQNAWLSQYSHVRR